MPPKTFLSVLLCICCFFSCLPDSHAQSPIITDISSYSAPVNSTIVISGENFSNTLAENRVFFGTIEAAVVSATSTQLSVTVPPGTGFDLVSVNVNGLTCSSIKPITIRFEGSGAIDPSGFETPQALYESQTNVFMEQLLADIDGDGKLDIIARTDGTQGFSVSRNTSDFSDGTASFAEPVLFAVNTYPQDLQIADMDGDGKPDIVLLKKPNTATGENFLVVLKNTASEGSIDASSFGNELEFPTIANSTKIAIADFDVDGRADVLVTDQSVVFAMQKNGSKNEILDETFLSPPVQYDFPDRISALLIGDLNRDRKPEVVAIGYSSGTSFFIRNNSINGAAFSDASFSFVEPAGSDPEYVQSLIDIDGDNTLDLVTASTFYSNTSLNAGGDLSFSAPDELIAPSAISQLWNDFDGDGLLDCIHYGSTLKASRGTGLAPVTFSPPVELRLTAFRKTSADLNGDGRPDLLLKSGTVWDPKTYVVINKNSPLPDPTITSIQPESAVPGSVVTINGTNFGYIFGNNIVTLNGQALDVLRGTTTSLDVVLRYPVSDGYLTVRANDVKSVTATQLLRIAGAPVIQNIEPKVSAVSDPVVITGDNFGATPGDNIVLFGAVQAEVKEASPARLVVSVPIGASYGPITVVTRGLMAKSADPFTLSYPEGKPLEKHTFKQFAIGASTENFPKEALKLSDIDSDGKTDIVVASNNGILVYRNISSEGALSRNSFAAPFTITLPSTNPNNVQVADLDGDGKADLVVLQTTLLISVYRNTSQQGVISFSNDVSFTSDHVISQVVLEDMDNDGKPDIVSREFDQISIFRNISIPGSLDALSFESKKLLPWPGSFPGVTISISDINKDHRPDIIGMQGWQTTIFNNISTPGNPQIGGKVTLPVYAQPILDVTTGDLNYDGTIDIVGTEFNSGRVSVFDSDVSIDATPTADLRVTPLFVQALRVGLSDMDGDGKVDILCAGNTVSILQNETTNSEISMSAFAASVLLPTRHVAVYGADLDGDGLNDLVGMMEDSVIISQNINMPVVMLDDFAPQTGIVGTNVVLIGRNFSPTPAANIVMVNGTIAPVISATQTSLTIVIPDGATTGEITVEVDGISSTSPGSFVVLKSQTIDLDSIAPRQYGVDFFVDLPMSSSGGLPISYTISDESIAYLWYDQIRIRNSGTVMVTATQAGNSEYAPAVVKRILLVRKGVSEIMFRDDSLDREIFEDGAPFYVHPFALSYSEESGYYEHLPITILSSDTSVASLVDTLIAVHGPGSAFLTFSHLGNENYEPYSVTRELVVRAYGQAITFDTVVVSCDSAIVFDLPVSASSGLPVSVTSTNPEVATVSGKTITLKSNGITDLIATQAGNKYYPAAAPITRQLTLDLQPQTITFERIISEAHVDDEDIVLVVSSSSGLPVEVISTNEEVAIVSNAVVDIRGAGNTEIIATQMGSGCFFPAEPMAQTLNVKLVTGLGGPVEREEVLVYPNPATGTVTISRAQASGGATEIRVLGSRGELVLTVPPFEEPRKVIDLTHLAPGVYFLEIESQKSVAFRKLFKL